MPRHLLDTRLNPSGELRDSAALRLEEERRPVQSAFRSESTQRPARSASDRRMRAVIQRVTSARVRVGERVIGRDRPRPARAARRRPRRHRDRRSLHRRQDPRHARLRRATPASRWTDRSRTSAGQCSSSRSSRCTATCARDAGRRSTRPRRPKRRAALYEDLVRELRAAGLAGRDRRVPGHDAGRTGQRRARHGAGRQQATILMRHAFLCRRLRLSCCSQSWRSRSSGRSSPKIPKRSAPAACSSRAASTTAAASSTRRPASKGNLLRFPLDRRQRRHRARSPRFRSMAGSTTS